MTMNLNANRRGTRRVLVSSILASLMLAAGLIPGASSGVTVVAAADPSSDIPGIELPGPVVAGRLGGGIYDVVYRFTAPAGHVIIASVTGAPGTDFDMYLFDASATTVVSNVGLLKKSTGPTSTESISWPSPFGGTYYIDMNGATNVEGDFRLTLQTVPDATPPSVSMLLAGGRGSTNGLAVPVTLVAVDDLSGVSEMAFSVNGATWTAWEPFSSSTTWTFGPGDGSRTLWVKVRNGVGLESAVAGSTVTIDTDPPAVVKLTPDPGSTVIGLRPHFTVTFDEAIDPATWTNLGLVVQEATGALIPGQYTYDAGSRLGTFVPAFALQPGMAYAITVGDVRDVAGNRVASTGSWTVTPVAQAAFEVTASSTVVAHGGSTLFDLTLSDAPGSAVVEVSYSTSGSASFVLLTALNVVNGRQSIAVTPELNTTYRFTYAGSIGVMPAQLDVRILVRRSVVLVGKSSTVISRAKTGSPVKLTAAVGPAVAGVSVSFRLYRFDSARRAWVYAGSHGRSTDSVGRASYTWVPPSSGSWYWRAAVSSTPEFANNTSQVYRWSITR